jgi:hypothetical protein
MRYLRRSGRFVSSALVNNLLSKIFARAVGISLMKLAFDHLGLSGSSECYSKCLSIQELWLLVAPAIPQDDEMTHTALSQEVP